VVVRENGNHHVLQLVSLKKREQDLEGGEGVGVVADQDVDGAAEAIELVGGIDNALVNVLDLFEGNEHDSNLN
jgi:hypothetical protein